MLGSVLCAPGCFSVYRLRAVRDVIKTYASDVEEAFDFLIKDMGEDRWFGTLMVSYFHRTSALLYIGVLFTWFLELSCNRYLCLMSPAVSAQ